VADEPLLASAVDLERWLFADRELSFEARLQRDRQIGRDLTATDPLNRVLQWWAEVQPRSQSVEDAAAGSKVVRLRRLLTLVLTVAGLFTGGFVCSAAFAYDGSYPVNLLLLLGVLVVVPALLLLLTLLALPGWLPGTRSLSDSFAALSLSRWALLWIDRVSSTSAGRSLFNPRRHSAFTRWQLVVFSQWFAIGFFAGALTLAWLLVAFSDLAFGWSTTLQLQANDVHRVFSALAWPWSTLVPAATPDLALTEGSQYLRLNAGNSADLSVTRLGEWWPFVLMALLVYGMLPRLLLLLIGQWRLQRATHRWLLDNPEVTALLDRLDSPNITFDADLEPDVHDADRRPLQPLPLADRDGVRVVIWNDAMTPASVAEFLRAGLGLVCSASYPFSVLESQAHWQQQLDALGADLDNEARLVVVSKGWEPPLLEFIDFLKLLRERLPVLRIAVAPVDVSGTQILEADREVWASTLARLHDPKLYVLASAGMSVS
jgi:hypothetical protein